MGAEDGLPMRITRDSRYSDRKAVLVDNVKCSTDDIDVSVAPLVRMRHIWFDYHKKCKVKIESVKEIFQNAFSGEVGPRDYFFSPANGEIKQLQERILRTNCIDCLDRTNVVQTFISRVVLNKQLRDMGVQSTDDGYPLELSNKVHLCKYAYQLCSDFVGLLRKLRAVSEAYGRVTEMLSASSMQALSTSIMRYLQL
jgi:hypothetical protein